jgi:hypothetical protein
MALGDYAGFETASLGTLTAAGAGTSVETGGGALTFQVTVSSIGTNVVIRLEGSLDDSNYFNLDQSGADTTFTINGTYGFCLSGCPVRYVRLRVVSINSGTPSIAAMVGAL